MFQKEIQPICYYSKTKEFTKISLISFRHIAATCWNFVWSRISDFWFSCTSQYVFFLNEARTLHYRQGTLLMPASLRCRQPVSIPYLPKAWHMKVYKRNRDARKMNLFYYLVGALNIWFTQPFCEKDSFFEQLFCAFGCPCIIVALYFFN